MSYPRLSRMVRIAIVAAAVCGATLVLVRGMSPGRGGLSDFAGYYTASSIAVRGDSVERMYDDAWFVQQIRRLGLPDTTMIMYVNPPPVALVMAPLATFSPHTAKLVWNCFSLLIAGGIIIFGRRLFAVPRDAGAIALFAGLILASVPFMRNLQRGQLYAAMLLLVFVLLYGMRARNAWAAGIALGMLLVLKYFGWMFLVLLLAARRWKETAVALASAGAVVAAMTLWFGPSLYAAHLHRLAEAFASTDLAITHLPAIPPFFGGLFVFHPLYNPHPLADAPWAARMLTAATIFGLLWMTIRFFLRHPGERLDRAWSGVLVLSVIATPLAAEHHYLLLIPALWHFLFFSGREPDGTTLLSYGLLAYLLLGWFPSIPLPFNAWYFGLAAYPHLYGALLLWAGLILDRRGFAHA